jgi:hypothetical protein
MRTVSFGAVDAISDAVRYRHAAVDPVKLYLENLREKGVPARMLSGNNDMYIVTPDDAFAAAGRVDALKATARAIQETAGTAFPHELHRVADTAKQRLTANATRIDFYA